MKFGNIKSLGRTIGIFILAYITIYVMNMGTYILVSASMGIPFDELMSVNSSPTTSINELAGFTEAQKFYPLESLVVGALFAGWYFSQKQIRNVKDVLPLAIGWLIARVGLDLALILGGSIFGHQGFALSPYSFYVEQAPWIYLTYTAVFIAPFIYYYIYIHSSRSSSP